VGPPTGHGPGVSETDETSEPTRAQVRAAELLPEEWAAGSADPRAQAAAVLADSHERQEGVDAAAADHGPEHRRSQDILDPEP